jgi:hypothetical protein
VLASGAALCAAPTAAAQEEPISFDPTPVRASSPTETIAIFNEDDTAVTLGEPSIAGQDAPSFAIAGHDCGPALEPLDGCLVDVAFSPQRLGAHTGAFEIEIDGLPQSVRLAGEGIPWLRVTPSAIDFGALPLFSVSPTREVVVENVSGRLTNRLSTIVGPTRGSLFRVTSNTCSGVQLAAGQTCRMSVEFHARGNGLSEHRVRIVDGVNASLTDYNEVGSVTLRGTTLMPPPPPPPSPDVSPQLKTYIKAALRRLRARGRGRTALLRSGLVMRGIVPPIAGELTLSMRTRRSKGSASALVAVVRRKQVQAGRRLTARARLTRQGKRLLRAGRPLALTVKLTLTANQDSRVSTAEGILRLTRARGRDTT